MTKTKNIALMIDTDWPLKHHHEVIAGIQHFAQERPDWKLVFDLYPEAVLERYDGVIGRVTPELMRKTTKADIPIVNTWFSSPVTNIPSVFPDFKAASRLAAEHLLARGFRAFGFAGYNPKHARYLGETFRAYLREAGYACSSIQVSDRSTSGTKAWRQFSQKLETWVDSWSTPIGVFASDDQLNRHLVSICNYKGIAIPQQAALIGTHNEPIFSLLSEPSLSSIDYGYERIGYQAAKLLHDLLNGKPPPTKPILLPPDFLVPRHSTDAYVVDDPFMSEALRFISENSHKNIKVNDVARGVNVTRRTLERRFEEQGGRTVAQEIVFFRIERLKRLLVQTDKPVKYLAQEVGFKDANQMYFVFRRVEGISPTTYRQRHGGEA